MTAHEQVVTQPLDFEHYIDTYGLGPEEVQAPIQYKDHVGTVAEMLADKECPVGAAIADAYAEQGFQGVEIKLDALRTIFPSLAVHIGDRIRSFHDGTTDRASLLEKATTEATPDFLV